MNASVAQSALVDRLSIAHRAFVDHPLLAVTKPSAGRAQKFATSEGALKMDVRGPRVRHRGFFLHSDTTGDHEVGETENPEGVVVRVRLSHGQAAVRQSTGRQS